MQVTRVHKKRVALMHLETNIYIGVKSLEEAVAGEARGGACIKWSTKYLITMEGRSKGYIIL